MAKIIKKPVAIPKGIDVTVSGKNIKVKGAKGTLDLVIHEVTDVVKEGDSLRFILKEDIASIREITGTMRALLKNAFEGVVKGYEKKLVLVGVGYRAQMKGKNLSLAIGFSHPIEFPVPAGITIETPSQTEIVIKGMDKYLVGQVAAKIRDFRSPEPYKGKGVRYENEVISLKEGKKK
jgi:large subunit ribosomal protein L6